MKDYDFTDLVDFRIKVGTVSSLKLCEIVVSNRYLGIMRDEAIACMIELTRRRLLGDDFNFEQCINDLMASLPKIKLDLNKLLNSQRMIK